MSQSELFCYRYIDFRARLMLNVSILGIEFVWSYTKISFVRVFMHGLFIHQ